MDKMGMDLALEPLARDSGLVLDISESAKGKGMKAGGNDQTQICASLP